MRFMLRKRFLASLAPLAILAGIEMGACPANYSPTDCFVTSSCPYTQLPGCVCFSCGWGFNSAGQGVSGQLATHSVVIPIVCTSLQGSIINGQCICGPGSPSTGTTVTTTQTHVDQSVPCTGGVIK